MKRTSPGFTILEVMVAVLFVGILATVAIYSLNVTRAGNRDAKRASDVSVLRAALTQYWLQQATYPENTGIDLARPGAGADRLVAGGFAAADSNVTPVYLDSIPVGPSTGEYYRYHGSSNGYSLKFKTERQTVYGASGVWYAHSTGVDADDSEK